jgi:uncharacterized membrane protein YtjA (UPF0391 family)
MFRTGKSGSVEFGTASKTRLASERSDSGCDANPTWAQPFSLSLRRCRAAMMNSFFRPRGSAVHQESTMLHYAVVFFVIALIAALFGFGGIAAGAAGIAKILFVVFIILAIATFLFGRNRGA